MKITCYSYRFAQEIIQHAHFSNAWEEIVYILETAPVFIYPGKSGKNSRLDVVQQVMNT